MGEKYSSILVGGDVPNYADGSIPDDGSQVEANRVKYSTITTDLSNPLHVGIQSMDAKLVAHVNEGPDTESGTVTLTTADHNKVLECSGTFTLSLPNPSGNAGFQCTVKNAGSGVITVDVSGGANIDGGSSITLAAGQANKVYVNNGGTAYYSVTGTGVGDGFASGTKMLFEQNAAPTGWTKKTAAAYNNTAMRISTGTVTDTTTGSVDFDTVFGITATDAHTLTGAESGTSAHTHPAHTHSLLYQWTNGAGSPRTNVSVGSGFTGDTPVFIEDEPAFGYNLVQEKLTPASSEANATSGHAHDIDLKLKWAACILCTLD